MTQTFQRNNPKKAKEYFENKMAFTTGPMEVSHQMDEKANIRMIDVRAAEDYNQGHIPGAVNLPKDKWDTLEGLSKDELNVVYCYSQTCHLAAKACLQFASKNYSVMEMEGGFRAWQENQLEIERKAVVA